MLKLSGMKLFFSFSLPSKVLWEWDSSGRWWLKKRNSSLGPLLRSDKLWKNVDVKGRTCIIYSPAHYHGNTTDNDVAFKGYQCCAQRLFCKSR